MLRLRVSVLEEEPALVQEQLAWLKKQIFGRKTEWSSVIMDDGTVQSRFRIFLRFQASARPPYVVSVYNNSTCSKTRIILRILIDITIIHVAKKHDIKTNESTIKTAAPSGALRLFCDLV